MSESKNILMVAAENGLLPGAKIGGVGDVLRDLPHALQAQGHHVHCVHPSYGFLARLEGIEILATAPVLFRGQKHTVQLFVLPAKSDQAKVYILHHDLFSEHGEAVYCHDEPSRPFASDASKFAFFCAAVAEFLHLNLLPRPEVLHCHDWHAAFLLMLLKFVPAYRELQSIRSVFSIHNLALQGIRPLRGDASSLHSWFPTLAYDIHSVCDPLIPHCINPMRIGILLADKVHTVSPSYALEVLKPSYHAAGIYGGENLEHDLKVRHEAGQFFGILNGCEYPARHIPKKPGKARLLAAAQKANHQFVARSRELLSAHWLADKALERWKSVKREGMLITSVGRVTEQKLRLLFVTLGKQGTALDLILRALDSKGIFILLGSGEPALEKKLTQAAAEHDNFIFLNGYSEALAEHLYRQGDLFLMPSSFEPCGISQLLAMRNGQACLVHSVGGLRDTVNPGSNGFAFEGKDLIAQAKAMLGVFEDALKLKENAPEKWDALSQAALHTRFTWEAVAKEYLHKLYS